MSQATFLPEQMDVENKDSARHCVVLRCVVLYWKPDARVEPGERECVVVGLATRSVCVSLLGVCVDEDG